MMSQTELLTWSEPDTKFFADNLLGVEDWGDSITDLKFNPDDLFLESKDQDLQLEAKDDQLSEFLSNLGSDPPSPMLEDFNFTSSVCVKEEPLSPFSSNSSCTSLPSSPENQFLINGDSSPVHQGNADFELLHASLLSNPANIKSDAALTPVCNVKKERLPSSQSCSGSGNMKPIKPMPVTTSIPVSIQKSPVTKAAAGIPVYIPCTGSIPTNSVVSVVVGNKVNPTVSKTAVVGGSSSSEVDAKLLKRQQRMIKNRESACLSRKKKKEYLQSLENKVKEVSNLNESLRVQNENLKRRVNELEVENTLLRSRNPELMSTIKKSTCVLVVVLFVVLNIGPFSNLKEQWRFNRGDFLHDSVVHRGRALLNYQGSSDEANDLEKPMMSSAPVSRGYDSKSVIKATHPRMLNTSQKNTHPLKAKSAERKDLMVIRNKWDFLGDSKHKKRNSRRKDRKSKSRRKFERKQQNSTLDEQFYCPSSFNKTEVNRINEALEGWVKRYADQRLLKQRKQRRRQTKMESAIKELALRIASNCTSDVKRMISRHKFSRKPNSASMNAVQLFQSGDTYKAFEDEINRKPDTLYVVSFRRDHLVFPATEFNATQRPKMSFMIMAAPNRTEWHQDDSSNTDMITMMQIDCQVMDTKLVNIKRSSIPVQHSDTPYFSKTSFTAPNGNTFVKPAK